jgi:hypothetical protein
MEETNQISRRTFTATLLNSLLTFSLLNMACERDLFAQAIKPIIDRWLKDLHQLCGDLRSNKVSQVQWQQQVGQLCSRIELSDLLRFIDFDRLDKQMMIPTDSVAVGQVECPKPDWMPDERTWGMNIFGSGPGMSIIPHGHHNMVSMHLILKGTMHVRHYDWDVRHYDWTKEEEGYVFIKPTIDRRSSVGEATTISDDKDNIHWLKNTGKDKAFTLDVVMAGLNPELNYSYKQIFVDPLGGEKVDGDLIRVRKLRYAEANKLYRKS